MTAETTRQQEIDRFVERMVPKEGSVSLREGSRRLSFKISNGTQEQRRHSWSTTAAWLRDKAAWCDAMTAAEPADEQGQEAVL